MGNMKAKSGRMFHKQDLHINVSWLIIPLQLHTLGVRERGAGSDVEHWTELIFPALSVQLRRAMVIGAVSDLPFCSSCCLVFLCWTSVTEGGRGCLLQAQECFWDGTSVNGMRIASRHEIAFVDYCRVSRHCRGFPKRIWWFLVDLMIS